MSPKYPRRSFVFGVAGLLGALHQLAWAQSPKASETAEAEEPEPVEVTITDARADEEPWDSSRLTTRVSAEDLRRSNPQSLADAMRLQPSVSVQQTTPGQGTIYVRGFSGRDVIHVVDGVRLNTAFFRAGNNPYVSLVDPYSLEELEVVAGPASVEYGSDGLGGALVMHTRLSGYQEEKPVRVFGYQSLSTNPQGSVSHLEATLSREDWVLEYGITAFSLGDVVPGEGVRSPARYGYLGLSADPEGGFSPPLSSAQAGTGFSYYATNGTLRTKLARGVEWIQRAQWSQRPELLRYDRIVPRFAEGPPEAFDAASRPLYRWMVSSQLVHRSLSTFYDEASAMIAWQRIGEHTEDRALIVACPESNDAEECPVPVVLLADTIVESERNVSDQLSARVAFRVGRPHARRVTKFGFDVNHDVIQSSARSLDLSTSERIVESSRYPSGSSLTQAGVFANHEQPLANGLRAMFGVRGVLFLLNIEERTIPTSTPSTRLNLYDMVLGTGLEWEAAPGMRVVTNLGRGLRAPNVQDLASLGPRAGGRFQVPNPELESESSFGVDLGLKLAREGLRGQVGVFWLRQRDAIVLAPATLDGASVTPEGEQVVQSANASSVEMYGTEAHLELELGDASTLYGRWLLMIGTQRNPDGTGLPTETPADRVPPMQGQAGVRQRVGSAATLEAFAVGRKRQLRLNDPTNLDDNRIPAGGTPGFLTWHVRGSYRVSEQLVTRVSLDNLTDELVLEHGSGFYRPGFGATLSIEGEY